MAKRKRFGVIFKSSGGISIGWTSINALYRCARRGYWSLLFDKRGLTLPPMPPDAPLLYGILWHGGYRALWKGEPIEDALNAILDEEELSGEMFKALVDEVRRDMDWYWEQYRGGMKISVLSCEEELKLNVKSPWTGLEHTLRGTPDLIGRTETGSIVMPDHKTFGVLSYTAKGSPRIELNPRSDAVMRYQVSRQFPYYFYLWNSLHPEAKGYDALLNMVPSHITAVLNVLSERSGNVATPQVHRVPLEPYSENFIQGVGEQAIRLCDRIAAAADLPLEEALSLFPENDNACVGYRGSVCAYYDLDRGDDDVREALLTETFQLRDKGEEDV